MEPGIYQISNSEYHASKGISRSGISEIKNSPLDFWLKYVAPDRMREPPTEPMILGSLVHTLVLEPHKFEEEYILFQKATGKGSRLVNQEIQSLNAQSGKQLISEKIYEKAQKMTEAILSSYRASQILDGALNEQSLYWIDNKTGVLCKARPDAWNRKIKVICDIKTTNSSIKKNFQREFEDKDYPIQAAMQIDAVKELTGEIIEQFAFVVVQSSPPYKPYIYIMEDEDIEFARNEYRSGLKIYDKCVQTNNWSKDRDSAQPIFLRPYQKTSQFYHLLNVYGCN